VAAAQKETLDLAHPPETYDSASTGDGWNDSRIAGLS
jgi:hypothetical protein